MIQPVFMGILVFQPTDFTVPGGCLLYFQYREVSRGDASLAMAINGETGHGSRF